MSSEQRRGGAPEDPAEALKRGVENAKDAFDEAVHRGAAGAERVKRDVAGDDMTPLERAGSVGNEVKNDVYNVGHESMNFTKEDVARKILEHVNFYLHFAEVGNDADQRNYEVSYEKIRAKGFQTTIDLDRGITELIRAARLIEVQNPFANV